MPAARAGAAWAPMSARRVWISAMRCGSVAVSASASRRCARGWPASTISIRRSGPSGASCGSRPMVARAGQAKRPCSTAMSPAMARNRVDLAGAVAADEADPGAIGNLRRRLLDQEPAGHAQRNIVDHQHGAGMTASARRVTATAFRRISRRREAWPVLDDTGCTGKVLPGRPLRGATIAANRRVRPGRGGQPGENMCVAGCEMTVRAALSRRGFFKGAAAAGFAATAVPAVAAAQREELHQGGGPHPHHVAGVSDLHGQARHRDAARVRLQEGPLQPVLVARDRACRHPSRRADPFLGARACRPTSCRSSSLWFRLRSSTWSTRPSRTPTICCPATISPNGKPSTADCRPAAASRSIPAGASLRSPTRRDSTGATSTAPSIFRALRRRPRSG